MANIHADKRPDYLSASARKDASREATKAAVGRELMLASILTRFWPAYLFHPTKPQVNLRGMVCIESPAGPICYRIGEDEFALFEHITDRREEGPSDYQAGAKDGILLALATDGSWTK